MPVVKDTFGSAITESVIIADTIALTPTSFQKVGEEVINAKELLSVGYGQQSGQDNAQGRIYMDLQDGAAAAIDGKVRLSIYNPQERNMNILREFNLKTLKTDLADRTKQIAFPDNTNTWITEDNKLVIEVMANANVTLTKANCTILFDVTRGIL